MNLKDAFRFQNRLQSFIDEALSILDREQNVTKVKNTYLRSKVMREAEDETVLVAPETEYYDNITELCCFTVRLLEEKEKLSAAIRKAKKTLPVDLDSETNLNNLRYRAADTFRTMNDLRSAEQTIVGGGTGYRFNAEGNQISYRCDVRRVTTINFNRSVVNKAMEQLNKKTREISNAIDLQLVTSKVDYTEPFDVNATFKNAFNKYIGLEGA